MEFHQNAFVENGGSSGGGCANNAGATNGSTWPTAEANNQPGFLSPSAVSAAAVAMGLSPTHLAYSLNHDQYHHIQVSKT